MTIRVYNYDGNWGIITNHLSKSDGCRGLFFHDLCNALMEKRIIEDFDSSNISYIHWVSFSNEQYLKLMLSNV